MNTYVQFFFLAWACVFISLGQSPQRGLLAHLVNLCLTFENLTNSCFTMAAPFRVPTSDVRGGPFPHILNTRYHPSS